MWEEGEILRRNPDESWHTSDEEYDVERSPQYKRRRTHVHARKVTHPSRRREVSMRSRRLQHTSPTGPENVVTVSTPTITGPPSSVTTPNAPVPTNVQLPSSVQTPGVIQDAMLNPTAIVTNAPSTPAPALDFDAIVTAIMARMPLLQQGTQSSRQTQDPSAPPNASQPQQSQEQAQNLPAPTSEGAPSAKPDIVTQRQVISRY